jgi:hypothetical protein
MQLIGTKISSILVQDLLALTLEMNNFVGQKDQHQQLLQ